MTKSSMLLVGSAFALAIAGMPSAWPEPSTEPAAVAAVEGTASSGRLSDAQYEVAPGIVLAGGLHPDALDRLQPGETLMIDLRTPSEGAVDGAAEAERRAIGYLNVPVNGAEFGSAQLDAVAEALARAGSRTVVLHCATGNRAGMIWGAVQLRHGVPLDTVLADLAPVVTRDSVRDALAAYSDSLLSSNMGANGANGAGNGAVRAAQSGRD
jgi:protein tyrosine phosphatase (PTP) superfamily phosphohydrolase (DUF442 family)